MSAIPLLQILGDDSLVERKESRELRHKAATLVEDLESTPASELNKTLPETLLQLITQIIKPLFSGEQHSKLTATGRKNLVNDSLATAANRFSGQVLFDDEDKPLWKNDWTFALFSYILNSYAKLQDDGLRRKMVESHFYLFVPAVLRQIDDVEIAHKATGCHCLRLLCDVLKSVKSDVLRQSGLTDVFIDALKNDFSLLPTLTPEGDSLTLFQSLYPAFRSLLLARFSTAIPQSAPNLKKGSTRTPKKEVKLDEDLRQSYLTLLLRHQCLHSLSHLSTGTGAGNTMSTSLSTFFLSQIGWIMSDMGTDAVIHLQLTLPLLSSILSDPFATSAPDMLLETVRTLQEVVQVCWVRIRHKWWEECLRGIVACWLNIVDDQIQTEHKEASSLDKVKQELRVLVCLLQDVAGNAFVDVKDSLTEEEPLLKELFEIKA